MADIVKLYKNNVNPGINARIDLGSTGLKWKDLWLSGNINMNSEQGITIGDEEVLFFDGSKVNLGTLDNPLVLRDEDGEKYLSDIPTKYQMTVSVIQNALININGKNLSNYTVIDSTISGYPVKILKHNGENLTREYAATYMESMTGSTFLPEYDFDFPKNSLFIMADLTLWKPQYDDINGLVLWKFSSEVQVKLVSGVNIKTIKGNSILGSGDLNTDPTAITNNEIDSLFVGILTN